MLTREQERKILESIAECDTFINKEEKRSPDLRPDEQRKLLAWYKEHKQKLINMIAKQTLEA